MTPKAIAPLSTPRRRLVVLVTRITSPGSNVRMDCEAASLAQVTHCWLMPARVAGICERWLETRAGVPKFMFKLVDYYTVEIAPVALNSGEHWVIVRESKDKTLVSPCLFSTQEAAITYAEKTFGVAAET
jgi:hypothetical protein